MKILTYIVAQQFGVAIEEVVDIVQVNIPEAEPAQ
jgi:hypothetical protein